MIFNANGVEVDIEDVIEIAAKAAAAIKDVYSTDVEVIFLSISRYMLFVLIDRLCACRIGITNLRMMKRLSQKHRRSQRKYWKKVYFNHFSSSAI